MRAGLGSVLVLLALVVAIPGATANLPTPTSLEKGEVEVWDGVIEVEGEVRFGPATTLVVTGDAVVRRAGDGAGEGSTPLVVVEGGIRVAGTAQAPVVFEVPVELDARDASHASEIAWTKFQPSTEAAGCALRVHGDNARIASSRFEDAEVGLCLVNGVDALDDGGDELTERSSPVIPPILPAGDSIKDGSGGGFLSSGVILRGNAYVGNDDAGLSIETEPGFTLVVHSTAARFEGNDVGARVGGDGSWGVFEDARFEGNRVGLVADGGYTSLDHARFVGNEEWDIRSPEGSRSVQWTGTTFAPSCALGADPATDGCARGAIPNSSAQTILLGIAASAVFLLSEAGRFLLTRVGIGLGLYSRLTREELLDHEARQRLLEAIRSQPGIHTSELVRDIGGWGRTVHHLTKLEDAGLVRSRREGIYRRFFPSGDSTFESEPLSTRERILGEVFEEPGIHAAEVARNLDTSRQVVSYHVRNLRADAVIRVEEARDRDRLFPR